MLKRRRLNLLLLFRHSFVGEAAVSGLSLVDTVFWLLIIIRKVLLTVVFGAITPQVYGCTSCGSVHKQACQGAVFKAGKVDSLPVFRHSALVQSVKFSYLLPPLSTLTITLYS